VSSSDSNGSDEFLWAWKIPASVKCFPICLKILFHLKNHQVFLTHPGRWHWKTQR
jgi:hypothetical protein